MIEPPSLRKGSYKINPVRLPICLSVRRSGAHFSQNNASWTEIFIFHRGFSQFSG